MYIYVYICGVYKNKTGRVHVVSYESTDAIS